MNHKSYRDIQLGVVLLIATLIVAFFTMAALSDFKLGLHFDKDMRMIAEVVDPEGMHEFINSKQSQGYEADLIISDNQIGILNISGVENPDGFVKEMLRAIPTSKVLLFGSFGSLTKFNNNQSFIAISLLVICLVVIFYQVIMNRMFGWYKALEIILNVMGPLFIVTQMGFALSISVWYGLLSIFLVQLIITTTFEDDMKTRFFTGVFFLILGLISLLSGIQRFIPVAIYWLGAGFFSLIIQLGYYLFFLPLLTPYRYMADLEDGQNKIIDSVADGSYTKVKLLTAAILTIALSILLSMARGQYDTAGSERGHYKEIVIAKSDQVNYLEIQALLSRLDLFDSQMSYLVSEQGETWIEFSSDISVDKLKEAQLELLNEFQLNSVFFDGVPPLNYFNTKVFNSLMFVVLVGIGIYIFLSEKINVLFSYILETSVGLVMYSILVHLNSLNNNQVWLLGLLILPMIQYLLLVDFKGRHHVSYLVESLIVNSVILMIFTLPIFVIVPSAVSAELILYFMILLISLYVGLGIGILSDYIEKGRSDGKTTIES